MNRRWLVIGLLLVVPVASGQNVFVTVENGTPKIIKQIHRQTPMVETGGKLVSGGGRQYGFARATFYRPGFVSFDQSTRISIHGWNALENGVLVASDFACELCVDGLTTSDTTFRHCFIVLDLVAAKEKGIAYAEIPDLVAGEKVPLHLTFPLRQPVREGYYRLHIFSDGAEVLHSRMTTTYVEAQKKKTTDILSGKAQDFPAILAYRIAPTYPAALKNSGAPGSVRVRCHINKLGDVAAAELVSASDPAFGDAALAVVPKWKFDPAIIKLQFVEADVEIPVEFKLPPKS